MSDLGELIVKILENGITLSTLIAAIVVLFKYREQHRIYKMLYLIGEKVGIEWKSSLHTNGFKITLPQLSKKLSLYLPMVMRHLKIRRKKNMKQLLSKKFLLAILGAIIPVINLQFGLNLDINTLIGIWAVLGMGIAAIAHVDAKTVNAVKVAVTADPNATYRDMIKTINIVHGAITSIHDDLKKDDGLKAFRDAADDYKLLESIVLGFKKPTPLPEIPTIPEQKVSA